MITESVEAAQYNVLNGIQFNELIAFLKLHLEPILETEPHVAKLALLAITQEEILSTESQNLFSDQNILDEVQSLQELYFHPNPQNCSSNAEYVDTSRIKTGQVLIFNPFYKLSKDSGYLSKHTQCDMTLMDMTDSEYSDDGAERSGVISDAEEDLFRETDVELVENGEEDIPENLSPVPTDRPDNDYQSPSEFNENSLLRIEEEGLLGLSRHKNEEVGYTHPERLGEAVKLTMRQLIQGHLANINEKLLLLQAENYAKRLRTLTEQTALLEQVFTTLINDPSVTAETLERLFPNDKIEISPIRP